MDNDGEDLPLVMEEVRITMGASAMALTMHADDIDVPKVVYCDGRHGLACGTVTNSLVEQIHMMETDRPHEHRWVTCDRGQPFSDVMLVPVEIIPGHGRLLISIYFASLTSEQRECAEVVYSQRKPFAIGYFRLWQLSRMRGRETNALKSALNLTEMGVMLVDRSARLTFANRAAKEMLAEGSGLRVRKKLLRAAQLRDSVRLQVAIEHVIAANWTRIDGDAQDRQAPLLSLERPDAGPLIVSVLPTEDRATEPNDVAAIIYALDPSRNLKDVLEPVCKIYHLSPVETRLTCLLASGISITEAAKVMRIKEMTARSYLKQVFIKTNTHRQTELMQRMLSSVIHTARGIVAQPLEATDRSKDIDPREWGERSHR